MTRTITLFIPEDLYLQVEQVATETERNIPDILLETISRTFAPHPIHPNRTAMKREIAAYKALHAELVETHLGEYVAIYEVIVQSPMSFPHVFSGNPPATYLDSRLMHAGMT